MYKCCIFDLDGTLVNSIYALNHAINLTLNHFGLNSIDEAHTKEFVGDGYKKLVERALRFSGDEELLHYEKALLVYTDYFKEYSMYRLKEYDGIKELLKFLKKNDIKIAVLSNKPHEQTVETVENIFGCKYFDMITGEKEGTPIKPDPAGALKTVENLCISPEECLYFGDTDTDMKTGAAAGMSTVGVTWGFREKEELQRYSPEYIIDEPQEIIELAFKQEVY